MKRILIATAATLLAAVPATVGLVSNISFAQSVPVRVPSQAAVLDDHGKLDAHAEPGEDKGGLSTHAESGDDKGGLSTHVESGDDKGGPSTHVEPGDDKGGLVAPSPEPSADKVSDSGSGKDDNGGHGVDTSATSATSGKDDSSGHS